jgi:hypothetical protein
MFRRDLIAVVFNQIPESVRDKFKFDVSHDSFYLECRAKFIGPNGVEWTCGLRWRCRTCRRLQQNSNA